MLNEDAVAALVDRIRAHVKYLRKELKIGQKKLERRSGVDQPTISRIEAGSIPTLPVLVRLVDGLGVSLSDFFSHAQLEKKTSHTTEKAAAERDTTSSPTSEAIDVAATSVRFTDADLARAYLLIERARALSEPEGTRASGTSDRPPSRARHIKPVRRKPRH